MFEYNSIRIRYIDKFHIVIIPPEENGRYLSIIALQKKYSRFGQRFNWLKIAVIVQGKFVVHNSEFFRKNIGRFHIELLHRGVATRGQACIFV